MNRSVKVFLCVFLSITACSLVPAGKAAADPQHYYYCEPSNSFFPYVQTCTAPWREFDPKPAANPTLPPAPALAVVTPAYAPATDPAAPRHGVVAFPIGMPPPQPAVAMASAAPAPAPAPAPAAVPVAEPAVARGPVVFVYGGEPPTIVCAVSQLCDVALQPGEKINQIIVGDSDHWKVEAATEGAGSDETAHLIIRPANPDLDTSMIVLTRMRTYHMRLQSHRKDNMLQVTFSYPNQVRGGEIAKESTKAGDDPTDDGLVKVDGLTYVKGREPKMLTPRSKGDEPPLPAPVPARPDITAQTLAK